MSPFFVIEAIWRGSTDRHQADLGFPVRLDQLASKCLDVVRRFRREEDGKRSVTWERGPILTMCSLFQVVVPLGLPENNSRF